MKPLRAIVARLESGSWLWWALFVAALIWCAVGGYFRHQGQAADREPPLRMAYVSWADAVALTNLAKVILEDELGISEVQLTLANPAPVFAAIADGDQDVFLDAWLPVTHKSYMESLGEDIDKLGIIFEKARIGLVVPSYVTIESISELNAYRDRFDGRIVGIGSGAGIMLASEDAIDQYNLDFKLVASSEGAMNAALNSAIENDEWIVVTGWQPYWMFARHDLKFLDDPKKTYGGDEQIYAVARDGFREERPEVASFLSNMHLSPDVMNNLLNRIEQSDTTAEAICRQWVQNHPDVVNKWLPVQGGESSQLSENK